RPRLAVAQPRSGRRLHRSQLPGGRGTARGPGAGPGVLPEAHRRRRAARHGTPALRPRSGALAHPGGKLGRDPHKQPGAVDSGWRRGPDRAGAAGDGAGTAGFRGAGAGASCCPDPAADGRGPGSCTGGDPGSPGGNTRASPDVVLETMCGPTAALRAPEPLPSARNRRAPARPQARERIVLITHDTRWGLGTVVDPVASAPEEDSAPDGLPGGAALEGFVRERAVSEVGVLTDFDLSAVRRLRSRFAAVFAAPDARTAAGLINELIAAA